MIVEERDLKPSTLPINKIIHGDAYKVLKKFPSNSIDCVITSPPYWAKRDYGEETCRVWGGNPNCDHEWIESDLPPTRIATGGWDSEPKYNRRFDKAKPGMFCKKCKAWYGQLGLEPTPEMFVDHLIEIFREVKRVLKPHGNVFVVIDDTYSQRGKGIGSIDPKYPDGRNTTNTVLPARSKSFSVPQKSLCLVPELFAIRMVYDLGFILRQKLIWAKKVLIYKDMETIGNAMPESCKDRNTHTYEFVYHFTKKPKYYYDQLRLPYKESTIVRNQYGWSDVGKWEDRSKHNPYAIKLLQKFRGTTAEQGLPECHPLGANAPDVIQINTEPFPEAHFAVFPEKLVEFLIKVGCPEQVCRKCGKPRELIYERIPKHGVAKPTSGKYANANLLSHSAGAREKYYTTIRKFKIPKSMQIAFAKWLKQYVKGNEDLLDEVFGRTKWEHWIRTDNSGACLPEPEDYHKLKELLELPNVWDKWLLETVTTLVDDSGSSWKPYAWSEYCECGSMSWIQGIVLDPFLGSGTTALVALQMGRRFIGIELNQKYCEMAYKRIKPYLTQQRLDVFV